MTNIMKESENVFFLNCHFVINILISFDVLCNKNVCLYDRRSGIFRNEKINPFTLREVKTGLTIFNIFF